jgi:hypothetical protein
LDHRKQTPGFDKRERKGKPHMDEKLEKLGYGLHTLVVFRGILKEAPMQALQTFLTGSRSSLERLDCYSTFVAKLYEHSENFSRYLLSLVLEGENPHILRIAAGESTSGQMEESVRRELALLQQVSQITPDMLQAETDYSDFLPGWETEALDFQACYQERIQSVGTFGYGMYAKYTMFYLENGEITPVRYPDETRLSDLIGYRRERQAVVDNTLALIEGKPAQNALLRGDAGTGKSSTVKAVVNEFSNRGLRLIEVKKEQMGDLPRILDALSRNPLKFIIFIDDLSFSAEDDCFGALKATLEGSVSARAENIAIYATSNRRHLIRESFSDREGDDVHRNDTMQQLMSLSARFGLKVTFSKPDKKAYMEIVTGLADRYGITHLSQEALSVQAEAFALAGSGRSARTAKQFIQTMMIEKG